MLQGEHKIKGENERVKAKQVLARLRSSEDVAPLSIQICRRKSSLSFIKMTRQNEMNDESTDKSPAQPIFSQSSETRVDAHGARACLGSARGAPPAATTSIPSARNGSQ